MSVVSSFLREARGGQNDKHLGHWQKPQYLELGGAEQLSVPSSTTAGPNGHQS